MRTARRRPAVTRRADNLATLHLVADLELRWFLEVVVAEDLGDALAVLDDKAADLHAVTEDPALTDKHDGAVADRLEWRSDLGLEVQTTVRSES